MPCSASQWAKRDDCSAMAAEGDRLVAPVGMGDANGDAVRIGGVPVDALVRDVQPLAIAVEQLPQPRGREVRCASA